MNFKLSDKPFGGRRCILVPWFVVILLWCASSSKLWSQHAVEGFIQDRDGQPLIGVNVQVKGSTLGTSSDLDGRYHFGEVPSNAILVISYVGFETQEVAVGDRSRIDVTLLADAQLLDEVVVVGY